MAQPLPSDCSTPLLQRAQGPGVVPLRLVGPDELPRPAMGVCSVADVLAVRGTLPADEAAAVGLGLAVALQTVHDAGVVHSDIKPANAVLSGDGDLWLIDFDAAGSPGTPLRRYTPGRYQPGDPADPADDVAAVAHTVAECCTGLVLDATVDWDAMRLTTLGVRPILAAELAAALRRRESAAEAIVRYRRLAGGLPRPVDPLRVDPTPTVDFSLDG